MDALETFTKIVGFWPNSFKPRENWRDVVLAELETWTPEIRAMVIKSLHVTQRGKRFVDLQTLQDEREKALAGKKTAVASMSVVFDWLRSIGLYNEFKNAPSASDRIIVINLVTVMSLQRGWEFDLEQAIGDAENYRPYQRWDNLVNCAEKAVTLVGEDARPEKVCYPRGREGWKAPQSAVQVILPILKTPRAREEERQALNHISEIANKYGGFKEGNFTSIYESPEYQEYLREFTARTGMQPG